MTNFSAAQAISPAIERTRQFLFRPFRLGTFLKLTLVAVLTEGGMSSCNFNLNKNLFSDKINIPNPAHPHFNPWQMHWPSVQILVAIAVVAVLLFILISYLLIRLRFSFFDCVLRQQHRIAPAWRLYHRQAVRYLGLSLCVSLAFSVALFAAGFALYRHYKPLFDALGMENKPGFSAFLPLIGIALLVLLALALVGLVVGTALRYFVLPHIALEDASISDAVSDVWSDIAAEPGQYAFFLFLRVLLTLAASIAALIALFIPFLVFVAVGAIFTVILKSISASLAVLFGVPAAILVFGVFFLASIGIGGTIGTFRRNYALVFYGGRYPPLGAILQPPIPPAPVPPPWQPGIAPSEGATGGF